MDLDEELRNISLGDLSIMDYYTKIKSLSDMLANIGSPVPAKNLVIYALNGLPPKFAHVIPTLKYQKVFPTFLEMRSIFSQEERSMLREQNRLVIASHNDHSSAPTVLNVSHENSGSHSNQNSHQNSGRSSSSNNRGGGRQNRGRGRGRNGGRGTGGRQSNHSQNIGWGGVWYGWPGPTFQPQTPAGLLPSPWPNQQPSRPQQPNWPTFGSGQQQHAMYAAPMQPTPDQYYSFPAPTQTDQPTSLPQSFSTMNLQDPGHADWYMDTGATAHLHADPGLSHQTNPPPV